MIRPTFVLLLGLALSASAGNALVNGDFEKGLEGWRVWGGSASKEAHGGGMSCEITSAAIAWAGVDQIVAIPSGTGHMVLSGWLRSDSVRQGSEDWNKGRLGVDFLDARDSLAGGWQMVAGQVRGKLPWTRYEHTYEIPAGAVKAKILCSLANAKGTLRCDDIEAVFIP